MPKLLQRAAQLVIVQRKTCVVLNHPQRLAGAVGVGVENAKDRSIHVESRGGTIIGPMNRRKKAFEEGLSTIRSQSRRNVTRRGGRICAIKPALYNAGGMPELNQIIRGDSIEILNAGP